MGARARRRRIWTTGAVAAVAVGGGAFHFVGSHGSSGSRTPSAPAENQSVGVSYGDSSPRVLARVGAPTKRKSGCWIYDAKAHTVNGAYLGEFADGVRYCFGEGPAGGTAVTAIEVHLIPHTLLNGKWYPGGWNHATVLSAAPPPS